MRSGKRSVYRPPGGADPSMPSFRPLAKRSARRPHGRLGHDTSTESPAAPRIDQLPAKQPRGGRGDNRPLEESPDTAGQGGRGTDPAKAAGKCHRNTPPKRRAAREPGAGKGEKVR
jgi:hypothetical protein